MINYYTKEDYSTAYVEILEILKHLPNEDVSKIPKDLLKLFETQKNHNYLFVYDENKNVDEQILSKLSQLIIANLYIQYWCNLEEKEKYEENKLIFFNHLEEEKRNKYNPDELFKNRNMQNTERKQSVQTALIEIKKENLFIKIINKIKDFFKR